MSSSSSSTSSSSGGDKAALLSSGGAGGGAASGGKVAPPSYYSFGAPSRTASLPVTPSSSASAPSSSPPSSSSPYHHAAIPQPSSQRQAQQQLQPPLYYALPDEQTPIIFTSSGNIVLQRGLPPPPQRKKNGNCDRYGILLLLLVIVTLLWHERFQHHYKNTPVQEEPTFEFESRLQCLPVHASQTVYPEQQFISFRNKLESLTLEVVGVGVGTVQVEVDPTADSIIVETHFHLTPSVSVDLVSINPSVSSNHAQVIVRTPACLSRRCSHGKSHGESGGVDALLRDTYYNDDGCVIVASRIRIPASIAPEDLPALYIKTDGMSIDARLPDDVAKPLFGKLSLDSRSGSVRAGGFDASALRLSSTSGSIKASTVRTQQTIVVARSGSVSLENLVSDTISATTSSGSIAAKNLTISRLAQLSANSGSLRVDGFFGTFNDFSATTTSGSVRINDFHVNHTLPASILTKTGSGSTRMQVYDFRGELLVKSNSGTVVVTGDDLIVERLKREVRGTRVGEKQIHRLQSSTGSGSATVSFL